MRYHDARTYLYQPEGKTHKGIKRALNNSDQGSANAGSLEIALHNETTVKGITENLRAVESAKSTLDR